MKICETGYFKGSKKNEIAIVLKNYNNIFLNLIFQKYLMKKISILPLAAALLAPFFARAQAYQTAEAESAYKGDGSAAKQDGQLEIKTLDGATIARVKNSMTQWGYVTYWMGLPTPAGSSKIRFRVYKTDEPIARYLIYVKSTEGQQMVGELTLPADAENDSFVTVDIPVDSTTEWSGIVVKKASADELPSPWIDTVSVLVD